MDCEENDTWMEVRAGLSEQEGPGSHGDPLQGLEQRCVGKPSTSEQLSRPCSFLLACLLLSRGLATWLRLASWA